MLNLIIIGFFASAFAPLIYKRTKKYFGWIAASFPLYMFISFILKYNEIASGKIIKEAISWIPSLGINFSFLLDGLSLTFVLIITLIGTAVFLYAGSYMKNYEHTGRFYLYIGVFMTSMIGLVLSDNMITLFVFWELTSISSYLLIGFNHHKESSRKSALQALLVTGGGGLALMAGLILLAQVSGSFEISALYDIHDKIVSSKLYPAVVILILLGAFTKSAQFPFHFWLPNAMEAPTPVSAYLHSATMVKAGIYLIARFNHAIGGTVIWQDTILIAGTITMFIAALLAFNQTDLKKLLAYSTLSVLGTLTMLLGIGSNLAIKAFFIFLVAHSLYKGTLFLVAGIFDHKTGTRNVSMLGGLKKLLPVTMTAALLASFSMMGIIPLVGFIGKETVYSSILEVENFRFLLLALAVISNAFVVMVTILVGIKPFFGKLLPTLKPPQEAPVKMLIGPILLAVFGLLTGLFPNVFIQKLLDRSTISILAEELGITVKLWHGFNYVLLLSFVTLLLGIGLYYFRKQILQILENLSLSNYLKPSFWYERILNGTLSFASLQTKILQNGYLRYYIIFIIITTLGLTGYTLFKISGIGSLDITTDLTIYELIIGIIIIASTFLVITSVSRLKAIVAIGVVGFCIGIIFILYSAPDLALTTFAIETLTVILFVLVLYRLPKYLQFSNPGSKIRDAIIAASVGIFMTMIVLLVTAGEMQSELKKYFAEASLAEGKGRNIVNVILVDFRAIDTLGEITVLAVAAIGVYALLKLRLKEGDK
ncbi:MAG: putative monovalent cation/H+ antiporter subunit A [Ignavibacteria bacterium]|nr:putative monovalent cation/H+ antiporter subunit A [Ignavibacteria bacterium]MBT8381878.1 putative monovalent cation/H+ antiporter subunit A [Ignavibacteria bacterium]MBT8391056.1 putative monovalent cation/H+ antiporter subunit A [Ignavibacteria bacterium]NNJ54469.1 putative monovalent cation/H+ antiporter subunit A [Ignavibacteriaceae bacterium]NNL21842.1 putative monovalent cation/H+ antiporter subunit A [Ignavibacteriaceae bacterium]